MKNYDIPHKTNIPRYVIDLARNLRKNMTEAEMLLWKKLRRKQVAGLRFRQQYPIGRYIADFCCPEIGLIVEVDGGIHDDRAEYDTDRDGYLKSSGYTILRFTNEDIINLLPDVLSRIKQTTNG